MLQMAAAGAIAAIALLQVAPRPEVVAVTRVIDGNTIEIGARGRVTLAGIRAPRVSRGPIDGEPLGHDARDRLEGIVTHRFVRLERAPGSRAAYVLLEDGTFVNAVLVREGLVRVTARGTGARVAELQRAEDEARRLKRGLWRATR